MAKTKGARSAGHDEKRAALLQAFRVRLIARNQPPPSLRELAAAAGVTVPTVRHYFGRREDLVAALLDDFGKQGVVHLERLRIAEMPFSESIAALAQMIVEGLAFGVSEIHALGLREGLRNDRIGPAYLVHILEPTLLAIESRFDQHQQRGEMRRVDTRVAAVALLSPLLIAHFHQRELGGSGTRPLDIQDYAHAHVDAFVRAHGVVTKSDHPIS
ncbi:hypothetical protein BZG35_16565 [Brevundimonas sp. LM2]|uniref:TetR/AcrR family transcriptional regulator n=1 Tax=Brevundimonas sp. LM2 TaxID=1938605 RepID=UPI000983A024|nr:TetR/AcrR family transcriptional regulator [Brevundimonas sp. LM2]AQR63086.1 hypothetical protein BZG35_16565 [Brevundimonas sp. LM2]